MNEDEFIVVEARNSRLTLENKKLRDEINILRGEKESMYRELLCMKNEILNRYDNIGKAYFSDKFYEEWTSCNTKHTLT